MSDDRPIALISGGSSGIGLACARDLVRRGHRVVLLARDEDRLRRAAAELGPSATIRVADVVDFAAMEALVTSIEDDLGPIRVLVTCAGVAEPGLFLEQSSQSHVTQMRVNYFGTLSLLLPVARAMARRRSGNLVLVASGAAFVGIYGYGAYGPSKFAVRGLAETLRAEMAEHGVVVSLAYPPDTDTPQYRDEQRTKPEATRRISAGGGLFDADRVGRHMIARALAGDFVITQGSILRLLRWVHSFAGPIVLWHQCRVAAKVSRSRKRLAPPPRHTPRPPT